jgi:hypothetical protein
MPNDQSFLGQLDQTVGGLGQAFLQGLDPQSGGGGGGLSAQVAAAKFNASREDLARQQQDIASAAPGLAKLFRSVGSPFATGIADLIEKQPNEFFSAVGGVQGINSIIDHLETEAKTQAQNVDRQKVVELFSQDSFVQLDSQEQFRQLAVITKDADEAAKLVKGLHGDPSQMLDPSSMALERERMADNFKPFRDAANQFYALKNSFEQPPNPVRDVAMIFEFMKALDPTSVVREGEQATVQNAASVPERVRSFYNRLIGGEKISGELERGQMVEAARDAMRARASRQAELESGYNRFHAAIATPKNAEAMGAGLWMTPQDHAEFLNTTVRVNTPEEARKALGGGGSPTGAGPLEKRP